MFEGKPAPFFDFVVDEINQVYFESSQNSDNEPINRGLHRVLEQFARELIEDLGLLPDGSELVYDEKEDKLVLLDRLKTHYQVYVHLENNKEVKSKNLYVSLKNGPLFHYVLEFKTKQRPYTSLSSFNGMPCDEAADCLDLAVEYMETFPQDFDGMKESCDYPESLDFLRKVQLLCRCNPAAMLCIQ